MKIQIKVVFLTIYFVSFSAFSHVDTILKLEGGSLIGLPEEFSPASMDIAQGILEIAGKRLKFPDCISNFFDFRSEDLLITASWYHETLDGSLPAYITLGTTEQYPDNSLVIDIENLVPIPSEWGFGKSEDEKICVEKFVNDGT
ncbi:hypothetical protein [Glaciecola sp. SC05]|uniref:hypothetical protein n=1 Tax=Glaciecola sp. SC05 TaxID=1987355 RepID=UPI003529A971